MAARDSKSASLSALVTESAGFCGRPVSLAAYGFYPAKDLFAKLLTLNQSFPANLANGTSVTTPGLLLDGKERLGYITPDCTYPPRHEHSGRN